MVKALSAPEIQMFGFGIFSFLGVVTIIYLITVYKKGHIKAHIKAHIWAILYLLGFIGGGLVASSVFTNKKIEEWEKNPGSGGMKYWLNNNHLSWLGGINIHWFIVLVFGVFLIVWLGVVVAMWGMVWIVSWRKRNQRFKKLALGLRE
jgi:hypothetical protein